MTDIAATLQECHALVWEYRQRLEHVWPTPSTEDALLFAFTELGEAVDAYLRSKPEYARNNARNMDVLDELADCAMMLLTALGRDARFGGYVELDIEHTWIEYVRVMRDVLHYHDLDGPVGWRLDAEIFLRAIATHPDMDLPARLRARLERIAAKNLPQVECHQ